MSETRACLQRVKTCLGLGALVACFLLWSPGVRTVRAGDDSSPPQPQVTPKAAPAPTVTVKVKLAFAPPAIVPPEDGVVEIV